MSVLRCVDCSDLIDTDIKPEVFREEFSDDPLCDECYENRLNTLEAMSRSHYEDGEE